MGFRLYIATLHVSYVAVLNSIGVQALAIRGHNSGGNKGSNGKRARAVAMTAFAASSANAFSPINTQPPT